MLSVPLLTIPPPGIVDSALWVIVLRTRLTVAPVSTKIAPAFARYHLAA
jgi:hypothetical protein